MNCDYFTMPHDYADHGEVAACTICGVERWRALPGDEVVLPDVEPEPLSTGDPSMDAWLAGREAQRVGARPRRATGWKF